MEQVNASLLQQALDIVEELPPEDQETLIELIRAEIAGNAAATLQAVREGRACFGSVEDLERDLSVEP